MIVSVTRPTWGRPKNGLTKPLRGSLGLGQVEISRLCRRCVAAGLAEPEFAVADGFVTTIRRAPLRDHEAAGAEQRANTNEI